MKPFLYLVIAALMPCSLSGANLDTLQAVTLASKYLGTTECSVIKETDTYCVIKRKKNKGFVIILRNGNGYRIIGYSLNSIWSERELPSTIVNWLHHLDSIQVGTMGTIRVEEDDINNGVEQKMTISPLLTSHWHQDSPYNDLSPVITDGNVKTAAGCVAIAAAQIAYYWRKDNPAYTLKDTPVYPYGAAPITMSIQKGAPNNWHLMKDTYSQDDTPESRYAVAQLCYVLGTTSYLNYASSTGGSINDASNALYSQYNLYSEYTSKNKFNQQEWEEIIYREIENGRPILCAGTDNGGHAFVLDGFDSESGLYHFNFGWGGTGDGYYPIDNSEFSMGGYYQNQSIVYNFCPKYRNINATMIVEDINTDGTINITIDITNNSTLDLKCLNIYAVQEENNIQNVVNANWHYDNTIKCDGNTIRITANNIDVMNSKVAYLTDENKYVITELRVPTENGISETSVVDNATIYSTYDLQGRKVEFPTKGTYIVRLNNGIRKVVIIQY